ncbi:PGR5-like protein 1B, chloroplastic, partial [Linum perenne]
NENLRKSNLAKSITDSVATKRSAFVIFLITIQYPYIFIFPASCSHSQFSLRLRFFLYSNSHRFWSMAGACFSTARRHAFRPSAVIELSSRAGSRTLASLPVRISAGGDAAMATCCKAEGPSCIYVGPIETASKETLEALYSQARDSYYSGSPLIVDDMFDRVELKLRWYGSKSVVKYPRCSLRRQSTYSDAEEDISQAFALASIWMLFLTVGSCIAAGPLIYAIGIAYQEAFGPQISHGGQQTVIKFLSSANFVLFMAVGYLIGYPIVSASGKASIFSPWELNDHLQSQGILHNCYTLCLLYAIFDAGTFSAVKTLNGLWRNDLVALKGACPDCGEEVSINKQTRRWSSLPVSTCKSVPNSSLIHVSRYLHS